MTATTRPAAQPRIRHKRYPLMNHLSVQQKQQLQRIIAAYTPDLHDLHDVARTTAHDPAHDPAAVEVLLILLEICHILDLLPGEIDHLFTPRIVKALETWGGVVIDAPGQRRARLTGRTWVWLPDRARPQVQRIEAGGVLRVKQGD